MCLRLLLEERRNSRDQNPRQVVNTGKTYGRNDAVTIVNMQSGEERNVKYKKAEPLLQQGWVIKE
jgi:preprotein translocase subunit SecA